MMFKKYARGRTRSKRGSMNGWEAAYANHLEALKHQGKVLWYEFEPLKFRLAKATFYTPDFGVLFTNGDFELHEVKGHWEDKARVKIKCAAEKFPFKFIAIKTKKSGWEVEEF
jgi:hypothetical protein